jgi:hypothetical protein
LDDKLLQRDVSVVAASAFDGAFSSGKRWIIETGKTCLKSQAFDVVGEKKKPENPIRNPRKFLSRWRNV